ncbi:M20/M25/M40 family metallo-hydrolase [Pontibacter vulgaris]|uniref:M20/M25/M40 family metallo-hydrolase n=1 Tax=Pontibacter vulgaris TaxID=2905679 RepID=UPI001FA7889D|nr:M20/M25/M40 family metallo-hydrolase [Pontibacter vulgaris]
MKNSKYLLTAFALCVGNALSAQDLSTISEQETTRLVKTLSADDMQGRSSFTPGIDKAADFIQGEFQRIGLTPLPAAKGSFKQTFYFYKITPGTAQATLNGKSITAENVLITSSAEKLKWKQSKKRKVLMIKKGENARKAFSDIMKQDTDALVLVHPSHAKTFEMFKRYLGKGEVKKELTKGSSKVYLLTDATEAKKYKASTTNKIEKLPLTNVVGIIEGKRKDEYVLFSGHYDHIGIGHTLDGDSIANGADDDASGTSAMIMLANYYKQQPQPERTLVFAAFTAEEIGGFGSKMFSEQFNPDQIVAMFNIEMVGKPSKFGPNSAYMTGFERSDLGQLVQKRLQGTTYSIHPDPYPKQNLFYRSDNATLARLGVPAHTISSVQIDKDTTYHTVNDEFEMLDMAHLTNMIKAIALGAQGVVSGTDTPTRVNKALVE